MSGVPLSGIIENLPGTVTPYPTQNPALEIGGFRSVADHAARDAIADNFRVLGMVVVTNNDGILWELQGGLTNASWTIAIANGAQGAQGAAGPQGSSGGAQGAQGAQGSQGAQGIGGPAGLPGLQGNQGAQGAQGVGGPGAQGSQGAPGAGSQGAQGAQGFQGAGGGGAQGAQGAAGSGSQGAQGAAGTQGAQGAAGSGAQGAQGGTGAQGAQGSSGNQGAQGGTGAQGFQGAIGAQGAQGFQGAQAGAFQLNPTSIAALQAINTTSLASGTLADVGTVGDAFRLNRSPSTAETAGQDGITVVPATTVSGNLWERLGLSNRSYSFVNAWFVAPAGDDSNLGQSSGAGNALKTGEEISRRLSPGAQKITLAQPTTVNFAAGSYEEINFNIDWFTGAVAFTDQFVVQGEVSSSAAITLSAVTAQDPATQTSAQIATASGTFVAGKRVRVTSGAAIGAVAYCTGLNGDAQHAFISEWLTYTTGAHTAPAPGDTVVVDTLLTTVHNVVITNAGRGNPVLRDLIVTGAVIFNDDTHVSLNTTGGALFVDQCDLTSASFTGNSGGYLWSSRLLTSCAIKAGAWKVDGCSIQCPLYCFPTADVSLDDQGNVFDGGSLIVGGTSSSNRLGPSGCRISGNTQFVNGIASAAISVSQLASATSGAILWSRSASPGSPYTLGISIDPGGSFTSSIGFTPSTLSINCTNAYNVAGEVHASFADAPIFNTQSGAIVTFTGPGLAVLNGSRYLTAQSANVALTDLVTNPRKGSYIVDGYVAVVTAGSVGALTLNASFFDDSGVLRTIPVCALAALTAAAGNGGVISIETNGSGQAIQFSVTGIVTAGGLVYTARINCRLSSNGA